MSIKKILYFSSLSLILAATPLRSSSVVQAGTPGSVIINEIMYHPSTGSELDEYLELYNTTNADINLEGWCFSGITLCLGAGKVIEANGFFLVSPNSAQTISTYGETPDATYTGALSNGGETISLKDETTLVINEFSYDDSPPWPTSPDGDGPSLELRNTSLDNSLDTSWAASQGTGTPNAPNSTTLGGQPPTIMNLSDPNGVLAGQPTVVTATVEDADTVNLIYKINFDNELTLSMFDDGAHGDGGAGDNVYGASIPAQLVNTLVRFKVEAENIDGTSQKPSLDDSMNYQGYYVKDPSVTSAVPIIEWFISDADYIDLKTNGVITNNRYPCVVVYGDDVYDNTEVRIKGNNTRYFPKKGFKFNLPSGSEIKLTGAERFVDEFHMNADFRAQDIAKVPTMWWIAEQSGLPTPDIITTRLQKNGQFEGAYNFIDKYEKQWREDNDFDDGQMFEDFGQVMSGSDDFTNLFSWRDNMLSDAHDPAKYSYILDNNDLPNLISGMVFAASAYQLDQTNDHNTIQYYDGDTNRWSILYWDFDLALNVRNNRKTLVTPYDLYLGQHGLRWYTTAIYDQPVIREMYFRRLRTLVDNLYSNDQAKAKYNELSDLYAQENALDVAKWPSDQRVTKAEDMESFDLQKQHLLSYLRQPWAIPEAQTQDEIESVSISEVIADSDNANEYIKLNNSSDAAVDISGWTISGLSYTIPSGSVIPSNGSIYLLRDDIAYRASHASVLVAGRFTTDLGTSGTLELRTAESVLIDDYDY